MKRGLGTQLRHLIELLDGAVEQSYKDAGLNYRPRYTPVFRVLLEQEPATVGQIAERAGITQPAATQTIGLMVKAGLVAAEAGTDDGRQRLIRLTSEGRAMAPKVQACWHATAAAADSLDEELPLPLSVLLEHAHAALERRSFGERIAAAHERQATAKDAVTAKVIKRTKSTNGKKAA